MKRPVTPTPYTFPISTACRISPRGNIDDSSTRNSFSAISNIRGKSASSGRFSGPVRPPWGTSTFCRTAGKTSSRRLSHPPEQKMPRELPLLRWYRDIAQEGNSRGVIYELTNLVDECLMGRYEKSCLFLECNNREVFGRRNPASPVVLRRSLGRHGGIQM